MSYLRITKEKDVEEWIKCVTKTAEESVREAATRKQDQHILLKVQLSSTLLVFSG